MHSNRYYMDSECERRLGTEWNCEYGRGMTMQEFANKCCISYEAIRRQVAQNKVKLYPHMRKENKTYYLDDDAVQFLEDHRKPQAQPDDSNQVRNQIKQLRDDIQESARSKEEFERLHQEIGALKAENEYLKKKCEQLKKDLEEKEISYKKLEDDYNDVRMRKIISNNKHTIEINQKQKIIDELYSIIKDAHLINDQNMEKLLSIFQL